MSEPNPAARDLAIMDALVGIIANADAALKNYPALRVVSRPRLALAGDAQLPTPDQVRGVIMGNIGGVFSATQQLHDLITKEPKPDTGPKIAG